MKMLDANHIDENIKIDSINGKYENCENKKSVISESDLDDDVEGGWGYVVCLGLSVVLIIGIGPLTSVGLLFEDFLESIGEVTGALTITFGIGNAMVAFSGMLTTCALKRFSLRQVGFFGTAVFITASILGVFVYNLQSFIIVNGFIQAIGIGIIVPISLTSFNTYFHKRRAAMMSIVSVMVGAGGMMFPILVEKLMEKFGFRGTLAILAAINLNVIPGIAVMQPVKWHRKHKVKMIPSNEMKKYSESKSNNLDENCNDDSIVTAYRPLLGDVKRSDTKIKIITKTCTKENDNEHEIINNKIIKRTIDEDVANTLSKSPSLASLGNRAGNAMVSEILPFKGKWKNLIDFLDLKLFKDAVYCNICIGITLSVFADITFFTLEPAILTSLGYNKIQIAYCITVGAFADLISRILFAFASFYVKLKSRAVFFIGNAFMIIFRIAFVQSNDLNYLMVVTGCLGFFRHWILMSAPLVFADHCGIEKFPAAYGLNMMISGLANLVLGPLTGFIKETWSDFRVVIYYLITCSLFCFVPWTVEYFVSRRAKKMRIHQ